MSAATWGDGDGRTVEGDGSGPGPGPDRVTLRALAERLRQDADTAARLLAELDRHFGEAAPTAADAEVVALRAERDRARADADALVLQVASLRAQIDRRPSAADPPPPRPPDRLPILARDLDRWSGPPPEPDPPVAVVVAVPVGPPPLPPTLDDLDTADRYIAALRRLVQTPIPQGKAFHTLFDDPRYQALSAKLREAGQLAERLIGQVERSRTNKELLWHLMVARKSDEIQRKRR